MMTLYPLAARIGATSSNAWMSYGQPCSRTTGGPLAEPASAYPTLRTPASICLIESNDEPVGAVTAIPVSGVIVPIGISEEPPCTKSCRGQRHDCGAKETATIVVDRFRHFLLRHHPARAAGRVRRTRLTTTTHARRRMGETNREKAPSGAQNPSLIQVVPPSTPSTTATTPTVNSEFEIIPARQSPNAPDIISIARGNEINTASAHAKSLSPDASAPFPEPA